MRSLLLLRHGVTAWNRQRRIQGRLDTPLDPAGRAALQSRRLPAGWRDAQWCASPLTRTRETARLLGAVVMDEVPELVEMDWGEWEGMTVAALRARDPEGMRRNEARGLDFRPAGGESPRDVAARVSRWVRALPVDGPPLVVVTHKGVIRAALSVATGWDMCERYPQRLHWDRGHVFARAGDGSLQLLELNVALEPESA